MNVQEQIKALKDEAVALRAAGDKHGALAKVREMRALQASIGEAGSTPATPSAPTPSAPPPPSTEPLSSTESSPEPAKPAVVAKPPPGPPPPQAKPVGPPPGPPPPQAKPVRPPPPTPTTGAHGGRCAPLVQMIDGKWAVHPAGAALLSEVRQPLCVVACAGLYRTGKSFFLNALAGHLGSKASSGFRVGSTSESCTRGIDVCVPESSNGNGKNTNISPQSGGALILLDSEGIASMDQDETYDAQIFSLALLLSSYFVLNSMGVIDEAAIDRLFLITQISKRVCAATAAEAEELSGSDGDASSRAALSKFFPPLLWLLRDFVLELSDGNGGELTADQYMERSLEARNKAQRRADERNDTRQAIRELFGSRHCATLVRPAAEEEQVRQAVTSTELRPEFLSQMDDVRTSVLRDAPLKRLFGASVDGPSLVLFAHALVDAMNTPDVVPSIPTAWESVVSQRCREASDNAMKLAKEQLEVARSSLPGGIEWCTAVTEVAGAALAVYDRDAIVDGKAEERRAEVLRLVNEEIKAQGAALYSASKEAAERASESALGAAKLESVRLLTQLLDEGADSTSFSDCAARLSLEFESAFPLGPAMYDGCSPFAKAVADAADKAVDKASMSAERLVHGLKSELSEALAASTRHEELGQQLQTRLEQCESERDGLKAELTEVREQLSTSKSEASASEAMVARLEAQVEAASEKATSEAERRESEVTDWRSRLEKAEESVESERARGQAAIDELNGKLESCKVELVEVKEAARGVSIDYEAKLDGLRLRFDATTAELESYKESAEGKQAELDMVSETAEGYREEVTRLQAELSSRESELERSVKAEQLAREAAVKADEEASSAANAISSASEQLAVKEAAWAEERTALQEQLAHFHERAALLPERYAVSLFSTEEVDKEFIDKLAAKPSVGTEELVGTADNLAEGHLGNIAAVASLGVNKLWGYFGGADDEEEGEAVEVADATTPKKEPAVAAKTDLPPPPSSLPVPPSVTEEVDLPPPPSSLPPPPSDVE